MQGIDRDPSGGHRDDQQRRRGLGAFSTDERGVSEVYGTVLILSMAFITAALIIGMGAFVISDTTGEFKDTETQDAMFEFEDTVGALSGDTANASDEFSFPDGSAESLSASTEDGQVTITVESTADADVVEATGSSSYQFDLGTITHEAEDGTLTAYQGGALWKVEGDRVRAESNPPLDYDGSSVDFSFVSFGEIEYLTDGQEMTARHDGDGTAAEREAFLDAVADHWRVQGEADVTAPVHVTIEIESEFAAGWAAYMQHDATQPLDDDQVDLAGNGERVTFELSNVGSALEYESTAADFPEDVSYAGLGEYAQYNEETTAVDGGPGFEIANNERIAVYDVRNERWVKHTNPWVVVDPDDPEGGNTVDERELPGEYDDGTYEFESGAAVCLVENDAAFEDCEDELFGVADDDLSNVEQFDGEFAIAITDVTNADDDGEPVYAGEDTVAVETTVTNTGAVTSSQRLVLEDDDGTVLAATEPIELDPDEETVETFEWDVPYPATDVDSLSVSSTAVSDDDAAAVDILSPDSVLDVTIENVTGTAVGQTLTVEATVTNEGLDGTGVVWVETDDGHLEKRSVTDSETIDDLPAGESETVELEWPLLRGDDGDTEVTVRTSDDVDRETVEITKGVIYAGPANNDEAPFLSEYVTEDSIDNPESVAGGYPLDNAVDRSYDLSLWDEVDDSWTELDPEGVQEYDSAVSAEIESELEDRDDLETSIFEYTHYEIDENAPVCVVDRESDLSIEDACGEVNLDAHITTTGDTLEIGAEELEATLLTAQIDNKVEQTSTQIRDPIDVVQTVGQSGALIDDEYATHWPHSGPIGDSEFHVESSVSEIESESLTGISFDTGLGVRGVYEDEDCSWSAWPWADECPIDDSDLDGGTAYHFPPGDLFDFDFTELTTYVYDEDAQVWREAAEYLDDDDIYHIDVRFQSDEKLYDIPEDKHVRVHHDNLFSDWFLIGNWVDGDYELIAQDPDKYRYLAVTEQLLQYNHADDEAGLVTFNEAATTWEQLQDPRTLAEKLWWQEDDLATRLHQDVHESDELDVWSGLREASAELDANGENDEEFIVLVSNAVHDPGENPSGGTYQSDRDTMAITKAQQLGAQDRPVYTVGLGPHADQWLLETIAEESGGEYRSALTADELPEVFDEIATDLLEEGEDAIERNYTQVTAVVNGEEKTLDFDLVGETNVNDPNVYNQDGSAERSLSVDGFTEDVDQFHIEMDVFSCEASRDSGVTATVDGEEFPYSECLEPGESTFTLQSGADGYQIYQDGETPDIHGADWQQGIGELDTVAPYWNETDGAFDLEPYEAILALDARQHADYDGYVLLHVQTADELTEQHFEWERPVVHSDFAVDIESSSHTVDDETGLISAEEGETIETTVNVTNSGDAGTQTVSLRDDTDAGSEPDSVVDSESLTLDAGESTTVGFEWETERGDGLIDGDGTLREDRRTLRASSATDVSGNRTEVVHPEPTLEIEAVADEPDIIRAFDDASVDVTVTNEGTDDVEEGWVWIEHDESVVGVGETDELSTEESTPVTVEWVVNPTQLAEGQNESEFTVRTHADREPLVVDTYAEGPGIQRAIQQIDETEPVRMDVDWITIEH